MTPEEINDFIYDYTVFETSALQRKMNKKLHCNNMMKLITQYTRGTQLQSIIYGIAAKRKEEYPEAASPFLTEEHIRYLISTCGYCKSKLSYDYNENYKFGLYSVLDEGFDGAAR